MIQNDKLSIYPIRIAAVAAIGGFMFGFDMAIINGAIVALEKKFAFDAWGTGLAVSLAVIGAAIGALFGGGLADRFGRVKCMISAAAMFFISSIGCGLAFGFYDLIFWRIIGGMGVGAVSIIVPAYIAETSPSKYRGRLGTFQQLALVIGIFTATISNFLIANATGGAEYPFWFGLEAWRWMFLIGTIPAFIYGISAMTLPESPRFLVAKDRIADAENILKEFTPADKIKSKIDDIKRTILTGRTAKFSDLIGKNSQGKSRLYPVVIAGITIAALQQFVGINVIFYYGNELWQSVGFGEEKALALSVLSSVINFAMTIVAIFTIDKIGRKPLLLIGSAGMFVMLLTMSFIFSTATINADGSPVLSGFSAYAAIAGANLFVVFFGMSWGPVMWVMLGEMFNNKIRGTALAVAGLSQWLANFIVSTTFPPLTKYFGLGISYGVYAFFAIFSFFFVLSRVQETKGKELEDM